MLNYNQLKEILPQAYPYLLIDRVEEYKITKNLVAVTRSRLEGRLQHL